MDSIDYASIAGFGFIALIVYLVLTVGIVALSIWITYSIIWRAVRRGLREYHQPHGQNAPINR
jgi:hypothetical protein